MDENADFMSLGPKLPSGLNARQLLQEAATALDAGESRDSIVERFQAMGIDDEIACALVDVMVPAQAGWAGPTEMGTAWKTSGVTIAFDKDPGYAQHERRSARRRHQQRIVMALLGEEPAPANPEFNFEDPQPPAMPPSLGEGRKTWRGTLLVLIGIGMLITVLLMFFLSVLRFML